MVVPGKACILIIFHLDILYSGKPEKIESLIISKVVPLFQVDCLFVIPGSVRTLKLVVGSSSFDVVNSSLCLTCKEFVFSVKTFSWLIAFSAASWKSGSSKFISDLIYFLIYRLYFCVHSWYLKLYFEINLLRHTFCLCLYLIKAFNIKQKSMVNYLRYLICDCNCQMYMALDDYQIYSFHCASLKRCYFLNFERSLNHFRLFYLLCYVFWNLSSINLLSFCNIWILNNPIEYNFEMTMFLFFSRKGKLWLYWSKQDYLSLKRFVL